MDTERRQSKDTFLEQMFVIFSLPFSGTLQFADVPPEADHLSPQLQQAAVLTAEVAVERLIGRNKQKVSANKPFIDLNSLKSLSLSLTSSSLLQSDSFCSSSSLALVQSTVSLRMSWLRASLAKPACSNCSLSIAFTADRLLLLKAPQSIHISQILIYLQGNTFALVSWLVQAEIVTLYVHLLYQLWIMVYESCIQT